MTPNLFERVIEALTKLGWTAPVVGMPNAIAAEMIACCLEHGYDPK